MVDKVFLISDFTTPKGIDLIIPPFARDTICGEMKYDVERYIKRIKTLQKIRPITIAFQSSKMCKTCEVD